MSNDDVLDVGGVVGGSSLLQHLQLRLKHQRIPASGSCHGR